MCGECKFECECACANASVSVYERVQVCEKVHFIPVSRGSAWIHIGKIEDT